MPTKYGTRPVGEVIFYDKKTGETIATFENQIVSVELVKSEEDSSDDKVDIAEVIVKFLNEIYDTDSWTWEEFIKAVSGEGVLIIHFYKLALEYFKQQEATEQ